MPDTTSPALDALLHQQESLRVILDLISSEQALRPLLTHIVRSACELLGAERGTIGLVDAARDLVRTEAIYRMPPDELGAEMPRGVGLAGHVLATGQPVVLGRYGELGTATQPDLHEDTVIGMPIFWQGQMIGFFGIGASPGHRFDDRDVETLAFFARHAAIAIENARRHAQSQQTLAETRLLYQTSQRISQAADVDGVIDAYLEQVAVRRQYACSVVLYEMDEQGERVARVTRGRWTPRDGLVRLTERQPYTRDALDPPLDAGETLLFADVRDDPRVPPGLRALQIQAGRPALALLPLMVRQQRIGLVVLSADRPHAWSETDLRPYQATAAQLATAIDSRRQSRLLYQRGRQLAVLEERQRLARDLHDSVTQLIFSITLIAQSVAPAWRRDPAEGEQRIERLLELSQAALAEMRALLAELRPDPDGAGTLVADLSRLEREGIGEALRQHAARLGGEGLHVEVDVSDEALPREQAQGLFRIAQEALANVVKHARARHVRVALRARPDATHLLIRDDGVGFVPTRASPLSQTRGQGLGLRTMRERAEALGGSFELTSAPGRGTTVEVVLPHRAD